MAELEAGEARRAAAEEAIRVVAAATGVTFLRALAQALSKLLAARYVAVSELCEGGRQARTLAWYATGRFLDDVTYDLEGTPCQTIVGNRDACFLQTGARASFPRDRTLVELEIESYAGVPLLDASGAPLGLISVLHTSPLADPRFVEAALRLVAVRASAELERSRAERSLRSSEAHKAAIIAAALDGIIAIDHRGRITEFNPAAERIFGYRRAEAIGGELAALIIPPGQRDAHRRGLARVVETGEGPILGRRLEMTAMRADGTELPVELVVVRAGDASPPSYTGFIRDISERRRGEDRLRESERKYRELVELSNDLIWSTDARGRFTFVNRAAKRIYDYEPEEMIGRSYLDLVIAPERRAQAIGVFAKILGGETFVQAEVEHRRRDGSPVHLLGTATVVRDEAGNILGATGTAADITERKRTEEALRASEEKLVQVQKMEAIGHLAGGIAHDFNNILLVILGVTERLLRRLGRDDPHRREVEMVIDAGERAATLTRQLLAFSRKQVFQPTVLDLGAVPAAMEGMLRRLIGEDVELKIHRASAPAPVLADRAQLEQVLLNLAINARDAMPGGGKLTIETSEVELDEAYARAHPELKPGRYAVVSVTDGGSGMDAETRARVFEPFFTTKPRGQGTGLGLSTVYGIVKQSGGQVSVYSEPGVGTTFKVYLPRTAEAPEAAPAEPPAGSLRGSETVLLVEDDVSVRALAREMLEECGYTVLAPLDAERALEAAEKHPGPIHLVLTDVVMPRVSGREVAGRVAALRPGVKVLYMSAYTDNAIVHHGVLEPSVAFIQKPFGLDALARKVRGVLDAPATP